MLHVVLKKIPSDNKYLNNDSDNQGLMHSIISVDRTSIVDLKILNLDLDLS